MVRARRGDAKRGGPGRDGPCGPPPGQNPACGFPAPGSHVGSTGSESHLRPRVDDGDVGERGNRFWNRLIAGTVQRARWLRRRSCRSQASRMCRLMRSRTVSLEGTPKYWSYPRRTRPSHLHVCCGGSWRRFRSSSLSLRSVACRFFFEVCRNSWNQPFFLSTPQIWVKPRKSNVPGRCPSRAVLSRAYRPNLRTRVLSSCSSRPNSLSRRRSAECIERLVRPRSPSRSRRRSARCTHVFVRRAAARNEPRGRAHNAGRCWPAEG
jgi:hypothetical protein